MARAVYACATVNVFGFSAGEPHTASEAGQKRYAWHYYDAEEPRPGAHDISLEKSVLYANLREEGLACFVGHAQRRRDTLPAPRGAPVPEPGPGRPVHGIPATQTAHEGARAVALNTTVHVRAQSTVSAPATLNLCSA